MIRVGDKLGRFQLVRELGRGSNGVVFEAVDTLLNAKVALKLLHPWLAGEPQVRERFKRELLLTRRVAHPGICRLFDLHEEKDTVFITMEFVEGCTLSSLLKDQGLLHPPRAIRILRSAAQALHAAHQAGVIHRDLKPGNINVKPDDSVTILDFGIATAADIGRLTRPGQTVGSLRYIPPEVWEGQPATALGDIYALGVISYACLTGRLPYDAPGAVMMLEVLKTTTPTSIREINPQVDRGLSDVIMKAMAIDPAKRFGSAADFDHALAELEDPELRAAFDAVSGEIAFEPPTQEVAPVRVDEPPQAPPAKTPSAGGASRPAAAAPRPAASTAPAAGGASTSAASSSARGFAQQVATKIPDGDDAPTKVVAPMSLAGAGRAGAASSGAAPSSGAGASSSAAASAPAESTGRAASGAGSTGSTVIVDIGMILDDAGGGEDPPQDADDRDTVVKDGVGPFPTLDDGRSVHDDAASMLGAALNDEKNVEAAFMNAFVRPAMAPQSNGPRGQDVQIVRVQRDSKSHTPATGGMPAAPSSGEGVSDADRAAAMAAARVPTDPSMSVPLDSEPSFPVPGGAFPGGFPGPGFQPVGTNPDDGSGATVPDHTVVARDMLPGADRSGPSGERTVVAKQMDDDGLDDLPAEITDAGPSEERRSTRSKRRRVLAAASGLGAVVVGAALVLALWGGDEAGAPGAPGDKSDPSRAEAAPPADAPPSDGEAQAAVVARAADAPPTQAGLAAAAPGQAAEGPPAEGPPAEGPPAEGAAAAAQGEASPPAGAEEDEGAAAPAGDDAWDLDPEEAQKMAEAAGKPADDGEPAAAAPADEPPPDDGRADEPAAAAQKEDEAREEAAAPPKKSARERRLARAASKEKAAYAAESRAVASLVKKQGLIPGDVAELDQLMQRARTLSRQGRHDDALDSMRKARDVAEGTKITRAFVLKKLARFNKQYDKVETPAQKEKLKPLAGDISAKLASGDYEGANALLNRALTILSKR